MHLLVGCRPALNFALVGFDSQPPIGSVRFCPQSEKLRLTEEIARLEFAPVRVLRQLISIKP